MIVNIPVNIIALNNLSRHSLLSWVNETLSSDYKKIEDLSTGVAYCQLMNILFPGSIQLKRIKKDTKIDVEWFSNWRMLQSAFTKLKIEKNIPIDRMIKERFQDNFEFLQWFKKFYDMNVHTRNISVSNSKNIPVNKLKTSCSTTNLDQNVAQRKKPKSAQSDTFTIEVPTRFKRPASPDGSILVLTKDVINLKNQYNAVEVARDFYYDKLRKIERLVQAEQEEDGLTSLWLKKLAHTLFRSDDGPSELNKNIVEQF